MRKRGLFSPLYAVKEFDSCDPLGEFTTWFWPSLHGGKLCTMCGQCEIGLFVFQFKLGLVCTAQYIRFG